MRKLYGILHADAKQQLYLIQTNFFIVPEYMYVWL
jgi:hypothetical protein